ncbi:MAG: carboxylating nicotinate-nucleotide diphosphorylase [Candidatus Omnitrophica bacterium]|nr:carboxylating nicotinate-nucleotide diphosphorylase [Candidatus Omnitrophota bacterium]
MKIPKETERLIEIALKEDIGKGDVTTRLTIQKEKRCRAKIIFREKAVVAGLFLMTPLFRCLDRRVKVRPLVREGAVVRKNQAVVLLEGPAGSILTGERVALNFLSHLSGVATLTRRYVDRVKPYPVKILATRKTTPGFRFLEKHALRMGGGEDHRMGLYDQVLVKENHLQLRQVTSDKQQETLKDWVERIRKKVPKGMKIEVEAQSVREARELLSSQADIVLLDNLSLAEIRKVASLRKNLKRKILLGVTGGVTLANVGEIAKTGVERISVGRITHSAPAVNISLDIV